MFVNLSRRSQGLIERQLRLIEELEQSERDEEQLANLFRLDHLATRMRRNSENLLVLGGQEQVRRWNKPVPLIDVVRASLSEVEQYERCRAAGSRRHGGRLPGRQRPRPPAGRAGGERDRVLLRAHQGHRLRADAQRRRLHAADHRQRRGMSPEELEQANWRPANPPVIDFSAARRMGLFVVGRLAVRHGVRVELRAAQGGGLTAFVVLPDAVVTPGESSSAPAASGRASPAGRASSPRSPRRPTSPASGRTATVRPGSRWAHPPWHRRAPDGGRHRAAATDPRRHRRPAHDQRDGADPDRRVRGHGGSPRCRRSSGARRGSGTARRRTPSARRPAAAAPAGRAARPRAGRAPAGTTNRRRPERAVPAAQRAHRSPPSTAPRAATAVTGRAAGPDRSPSSRRRSRWCRSPAPRGRSRGRRGRSRSANRAATTAARRRPGGGLRSGTARPRATMRAAAPPPDARRGGSPSGRRSSTRCSPSGSSAGPEAHPGRIR